MSHCKKRQLWCSIKDNFHISIASEFYGEACDCCKPLFFICQTLYVLSGDIPYFVFLFNMNKKA